MKWLKSKDEFILTREELCNLTEQYPWVPKKWQVEDYMKQSKKASKLLIKTASILYFPKDEKKRKSK
jgi:hypothetical protein